MVFGIHFRYPLPRFSRPGGSGLLTTSRSNDFELIDRPAGRGLALERLLKRALLNDMTTLLYWRRRVKPAGT